jgi:Bacterial PH domain
MPGLLDPNVDQYVLDKAGEYMVLEVRKHWVSSFFPMIRLILGVLIFVSAWAFPEPVYWIFFLVGLGLLLQALWRLLEEYRDRFVITNQRVFRVHGVFDTQRASVPLGRILDITVKKPWIGHLLNYGHFVFESAAQVQGLNEIRYVADIDEREDALRMIMAPDSPVPEEDEATDDGT